MEFLTIAQFNKRKHAGVLVIPMWQGSKLAERACREKNLPSQMAGPIELGDFKGREGELSWLYLQGEPEKRAVLVGLGEKEKATTERLRRAFASFVKSAHSKKIKKANILLPEIQALGEESLIRGIVEGMVLANYSFDKYKTGQEDGRVLLEEATFIDGGKKILPLANKALMVCQGSHYARDLVNGNADEITPQHLAECARSISKEQPKIKTTILNKSRIEKENMGLLLAVNRGSVHDPVFIIMEYSGSPKSSDRTILIGKGITYDTGGLNLKSSGMETMKCDMAGAAMALATILTASRLQLKVNLTVVIAATENGIDAKSYKVGDVYKGFAGKTVEITNTDAEGRLILADALAYAVKYLRPSRMIDFATLTGGIEIALGPEVTGLMSNDDALAHALILAGSESFERVWRLPLYEEYRDPLKSDIADLKNSAGRSASSISGAMFLKEFVGETPWAHLDIASTAYLSEARRYHPKCATGVGVRLMIDFLEHL